MTIIKQKQIAEERRVVLMKLPSGEFWIAAQQKWTEPGCPWEVGPDGWRDTNATWRNTADKADEAFTEMVAYQRRWERILEGA